MYAGFKNIQIQNLVNKKTIMNSIYMFKWPVENNLKGNDYRCFYQSGFYLLKRKATACDVFGK